MIECDACGWLRLRASLFSQKYGKILLKIITIQQLRENRPDLLSNISDVSWYLF